MKGLEVIKIIKSKQLATNGKHVGGPETSSTVIQRSMQEPYLTLDPLTKIIKHTHEGGEKPKDNMVPTRVVC